MKMLQKFLLLLGSVQLALVAAQTSGNFSILSYNVAGLPELLSSGDPATNTPLISSRLKPYNIINVQEDFNYHAALYASDTHAYRTPTSGGAGLGSGLNTLSDFPYTDLDRVKWDACNLNSGDCLTPKGFTFARVSVADTAGGVLVDVYNLHTDAGSDEGDISARAKNFAQVAAYIQKSSVGMPVIVMGDTNARYTRPGDSESLHSFLSTTGLTDLWVSKIRGGSFPSSGADALVCQFPFPVGTSQADMNACEVVDKIFVRGNPALSFSLSRSTYANAHTAFVDASGSPLSDHYPILSTLVWELSPYVRMGDAVVGGPHGDAFNDLVDLFPTSQPPTARSAVPRLTSITLRGANRLDAISYTVQLPSTTSPAPSKTLTHGGTGGSPSTLTLASNERITQVKACSGKYNSRTRVFYIELMTNTGRAVAAGKQTGDCVVMNAPSSGATWGLVGFYGRSGDEVDRVAPLWVVVQ
ncbi:hypothetical protein CPC08DRAFT_689282 [Agrocybe pediades]|nr:hypothetical protein CPC08DRAFT_689282 [Agrocybe pediades]